jgi:hypothetical protein
VDGKLVVFVRRTPSQEIDTGLGDQDNNELWIAETSGEKSPRRILVGRPGSFKPDDTVVLAGFATPQFSRDGTRVYFVGRAWATSSPIFLLELKTGRVRFLFDGTSIEVIKHGDFAGCLIAGKKIPAILVARIFRYWLIDRDGNDVAEIGGRESDVEIFRQMFVD